MDMATAIRRAVTLYEADRQSRRRAQVVGQLERKLAADYRRIFALQQREFMKRFAGLKPLFPKVRESITAMDIGPLWDEASAAWLNSAVDAIQAASAAALLAAAENLIAALAPNMDISFNLDFPGAVEYLTQHGAEQVRRIDETTRRVLNRIVTDAGRNGWSWSKTAEAIIEQFEDFAGPPLRGGPSWLSNRAELVAVTEVGNAYEYGSRLAAKRLQLAGLEIEKAWSGPDDNATSAACRENLGAGWIDLDALFPSGDMQPLNHPGCRHTCLYRRKGSGA